MNYDDGVIISFYIYLYQLIMFFYYKNSQLERNLNKVGLRLSYLTLSPKQYNNEKIPFYKRLFKFIIVQFFSFLSIFLSWFFVAYFVFMQGRELFNKFGMPQSIKEYRWKMRNMDLSFDNIIKLDMAARDIPIENFDEIKATTLEEMSERGFI